MNINLNVELVELSTEVKRIKVKRGKHLLYFSHTIYDVSTSVNVIVVKN